MFLLLACGPTSPFVTPDSKGTESVTVPLESVPSMDTGDTGTTDTGDDDAIYAAFFDPSVVQEIRIELSDAAIRQLNADGRTYVEGNVVVNGVRMDSVGIRLKGSSTYQDFSGKPAFKIKTNEYVPGQKYGDLERLTFNNMIGDPTQSKEVMVYQLWQEAGMTGPRCNFARVYVNDALFGLYSNIESMDDHWVKRRYADDTGDLWGTASGGADFNADGLLTNPDGSFAYWVLKSGVGDQEPFYAIRADLNQGTGDWMVDFENEIDTNQYLDFWAWSVVFGNQDGYPFHTNDVLLYADPQDNGRFDFSPWGMDESYDATVLWNYVSGTLSLACANDPACVKVLFTKMKDDVAVYETLPVDTIREAAYDVSLEDLKDDPKRSAYYSTSDVLAYRRALADTQSTWANHVRQTQGL